MEDGKMGNTTTIRAVLAILQWWGFNVTIIIMNKWIFQKPSRSLLACDVCSVRETLKEHCAGKCQPAVHSSLLHADDKIFHSCDDSDSAVRKYFGWRIWASLVPIVGGIMLTSITELSFNMSGFCAAMIGCLVTSTKTILAESLLHGYKFDSINTAPFILSVPAIVLEGSGVIRWLYTYDAVAPALVIIVTSGVLAFCLNFSIFYVTFNVAGNLKVAVAVLVSWMIFRNPISAMNAVGCTFYCYVRHLISQQAAAERPDGDAAAHRRETRRQDLAAATSAATGYSM